MKVQDLKDTPRRNEELKNLKNLDEEDMPRLLEKVAKSCKAKTGVVCDGFHPKVPVDLTKKTRGKVVEFLKKVVQCGRRPQQACTTMFFLESEERYDRASCCAHACDGSLVRSLASARGYEMATQISF